MKKYRILGAVSALVGLIACSDSATPIKLKGQASLRLADGTPISQAATDEYNPYVVKMPDGFLILVFGSDRSCGGCSAGTHNIFVARSVAAYNDDQKIPAFQNPSVFTVASTPLNLSSAATFVATKSGASLRLYFNNAQGIIQYGDFVPSVTSNVASVMSIVNSVWRKMTLIGIDEDGLGLFVRASSGSVYWLNPGVINIALTALSSETGLTSLARISAAQVGSSDAYIGVKNGSPLALSFSSSGGVATRLQTVFANAKVTLRSLAFAYSGKAAGDLVLISASDAVNGARDLYLVESATPISTWSEVTNKPATGSPSLAPQTANIYAWYEFDGNRNDVSGAGNNAGLTMGAFSGVDANYTATDRFGVANAAASFNGSSQYVLNSFLAKCDENFSVSLWLRPTVVSVDKTFVGHQSSPGANPGFTLNQFNTNQFLAQSLYDQGANTANNYGFGGTVTLNQWTHFAYVHDATARVGVVYINGAAVVTTTNTAGAECGTQCTCSGVSPVTAPQQWRSSTPMTIGYGYRGYFQGQLDQVAFFNRKLTLAEIQTLAAQ